LTDQQPHPSAIWLERFSVGDLPGSSGEEIARHVAGCPTCGQYLTDLEVMRLDRLAAVPPDKFVALVAARRDREVPIADRLHRRRLGVAILTVAASAAAAFLLMPRSHPDAPLGLKGAGVTLHRNRGGDERVMTSDDHIRSGDALRVVVTLPRPNQVAAWSVDASGRVDSWLAGGPLALPAGEQAFPESAIVESPCLDLTVVVVVGAAARVESGVALRQAAAHGIPAGDDWLPAGAIVWKFQCE
jgi:hypothetical protein